MKNRNTPSVFNITALALAFSTVVASAHPGHSLSDQTLTHTLTSPYHLLTLALLGGGLLLGASFIQRLATRRAMQITGITAGAMATLTFVSQLLH